MSQTDSEPKDRKRRKKTIFVVAGGLATVVLLLIFVCQFLGIRSKMDIIAYRAMIRGHYHPIWKDLALRRIKRGDDLDTLLKKHTPLRRQDAGPYTELVYTEGGASPGLTVMAKDGRLIAAAAGTATWRHVFFDAPEQMEGFGQAHMKYRKQRQLETNAYQIHRAITSGQDVFLSEHVERSEVPDSSSSAKKMMEQLKEIYGDRYLKGKGKVPTRVELAVEVNEVLYGDLEPGMILTFPESHRALNDRDRVFLHFEDDRVIYPRARGEALYLIVPRSALDWYQSLTPDQIQEF